MSNSHCFFDFRTVVLTYCIRAPICVAAQSETRPASTKFFYSTTVASRVLIVLVLATGKDTLESSSNLHL